MYIGKGLPTMTTDVKVTGDTDWEVTGRDDQRRQNYRTHKRSIMYSVKR